MSLLIAAAILSMGQTKPPTLVMPDPTPPLALSDETISQPRWAVRPVPQYPIRALSQGIAGGEVVVRCVTTAEGELDACSVVSETPEGYGFAEEALRASIAARVQGEGGEQVRFRVRFVLAD